MIKSQILNRDCPLYDRVSACLLSLIYPWFPDSHSHCPILCDSTTVIVSFVSLLHHWKCSFLCQKLPPRPPPPPTQNGLPRSWEKKQVESESPSHLAVSDSLQPHRLYLPKLLCPWNSPDNNTAVGSHSLLQGIFPTWGPNLGLPHCSLLSGLPGKPLLMFKAQIWKFMSFVPHLPHHFHPSSAQFILHPLSLSLDSLHWLSYNACCSIAVKNIHFAKSYASG